MNMILPWIITIGFYVIYFFAWLDLWVTLRWITWEDRP